MNYYGSNSLPFLFFTDFKGLQSVVIPISELPPTGILYEFNGIGNHSPHFVDKSLEFSSNPLDFIDYQRQFNQVCQAINQGNSYLLNLTTRTPIETNYSLFELFAATNARYRLVVPNEFVVFSPEIFVQIRDGVITSHPMKGTIDATIAQAQEIILKSEKESAEHATIVDLIRNDLNIVATDVKVENYRYFDLIHSQEHPLYQVSSKISGRLTPDYQQSIGDIIYDLLPAGSVTGAPKASTVRLIEMIETAPRGFYTGVCGMFDGHNLDSGVMIRFICREASQFYYHSGGGITYRSEAEREYQELIDKIYVPIYRKYSLPTGSTV